MASVKRGKLGGDGEDDAAAPILNQTLGKPWPGRSKVDIRDIFRSLNVPIRSACFPLLSEL